MEFGNPSGSRGMHQAAGRLVEGVLDREAFAAAVFEQPMTLGGHKRGEGAHSVEPGGLIDDALAFGLDLRFTPHPARGERLGQNRLGLPHPFAARQAVAAFAPGPGIGNGLDGPPLNSRLAFFPLVHLRDHFRQCVQRQAVVLLKLKHQAGPDLGFHQQDVAERIGEWLPYDVLTALGVGFGGGSVKMPGKFAGFARVGRIVDGALCRRGLVDDRRQKPGLLPEPLRHVPVPQPAIFGGGQATRRHRLQEAAVVETEQAGAFLGLVLGEVEGEISVQPHPDGHRETVGLG